MSKFLLVFCLALVTSCTDKKEVLLPKSDVSIVTEVLDNSPIYIFFKTGKRDTIADVNRKNSIISTNWLFNIDKRLPLKLVIPEVIKLQEKKRNEKAHKNEKAENYYSYADSIGKNLAFLPFTTTFYKCEKPNKQILLFFKRDKTILWNDLAIDKENLIRKLDSLSKENVKTSIMGFDRNLDYGSYIQYKILVHKVLNIEASEEFIY